MCVEIFLEAVWRVNWRHLCLEAKLNEDWNRAMVMTLERHDQMGETVQREVLWDFIEHLTRAVKDRNELRIPPISSLSDWLDNDPSSQGSMWKKEEALGWGRRQ